jgi:hypothetical protein
MNFQTDKRTSEVALHFWPWFFFAAAFQSLLAVARLVRVPSEGLSFARLAMFGILAFLHLLEYIFGFTARRDPSRFDRFARTPFITAAALLTLTSSLLLFLLRYLNPEQMLPYYERMSPLLWLLFILSAELAVFLLLLKNGFYTFQILPQGTPFTSPRCCILPSALVFCSSPSQKSASPQTPPIGGNPASPSWAGNSSSPS